MYASTLDDGTGITFRPVSPSDKPLFVEGLKALSADSRYRRFFRHIDSFTDQELRYLTEVDGKDHVAWIAVVTIDGREHGIAVGRWVRLLDDPRVAEPAITVVDDFHGKGIGKTLLWLLAREAIANEIGAFRAWVIGDNHPMLAILGAWGAAPTKWESGVGEITIELPQEPDDLPSTSMSLILKAVATGELPAVAHPTGGTAFGEPGAR